MKIVEINLKINIFILNEKKPHDREKFNKIFDIIYSADKISSSHDITFLITDIPKA